MHSLSAPVCSCLSETVCAHTLCMWVHCSDMLSCRDLRLTTASSLSLGGSPTSFFLTLNTSLLFVICFLFLLLFVVFSVVNVCSQRVQQLSVVGLGHFDCLHGVGSETCMQMQLLPRATDVDQMYVNWLDQNLMETMVQRPVVSSREWQSQQVLCGGC